MKSDRRPLLCFCNASHCYNNTCSGQQCYFITDGLDNGFSKFGCHDRNDWKIGCSFINSQIFNQSSSIIETGKHSTFCCDHVNFCNRLYQNQFISFLHNLTSDDETNKHSTVINSQIDYSLVVIIGLVILVCLIIICGLAYKLYEFYVIYPNCAHSEDFKLTTNTAETNDQLICNLSNVESGYSSSPGTAFCRTIANDITFKNMIGNGQFGCVYRAIYQSDNVAVKKFNEKDVKSFQIERNIYTCCSMTHKNILRFFAADTVSFETRTEWWLITEYCSFGSLDMFLLKQSIPLSECLNFSFAIASGLSFLHKEIMGFYGKPAIAHRDMKTSNVLVRSNKRCVIGDFGQAIYYGRYPQFEAFDSSSVSIFVGTRRYMAPEVLNKSINSKDFDAFKKTDIYSLGLIFWEVGRRALINGYSLTYQTPFEDVLNHNSSISKFCYLICDQKRRPEIPLHWNSSVAMSALSLVIEECWRPEPDGRLTAYCVKKRIIHIIRNYIS